MSAQPPNPVGSGQTQTSTEPATSTDAAIAIARAEERLRQERETFDERKRQAKQWFRVRLAVSWVSVILIPAIAIFCGYVVGWSDLEVGLKKLTAGVLLGDVLAIAGIVWRGFAGLNPPTDLGPTTEL